jgi:sulfur relay (sulfurtransferase) DsrF/TusC family protein
LIENGQFKVGLIIRSGPSGGHSARDQLDVALAAASLEFELELFFLGAGIQQLRSGQDQNPAGHKGWKALPGLTRVNAWALDSGWKYSEEAMSLEVTTVNSAELAARIAGCSRIMVV